MSRPEESTVRDLCGLLIMMNHVVPVRLMEEILDHGDEAVEPLLEALGRALDERLAGGEGEQTHAERDGDDEGEFEDELAGAGDRDALDDDDDTFEDDGLSPAWPAVLLGVLGNPAAAPALADMIRRTARGPFYMPLTASEALARIGPPALPVLKELSRDPDPVCRIWAYGALGGLPDDEAYELLTGALTTETDCLDSVANALHQHGRAEAIPALYEAFQRAEPWQRLELKVAIQDLHAGEQPKAVPEPDWRLRYRPEPAIGAMAPSWPVVAAVVHDEGLEATRTTVPVQPLDQILAEPRTEDNDEDERCDCCGVPPFEGIGVPVCPATAVAVTLGQHELLGRYRKDYEIEDLFELLTDVEFEAMDMYHWESEPSGRRARERWNDRLLELELARGACRWLIQEGVESVGGGRARLLVEALRLAHEHGDPSGLLRDPGPVRSEGPQVGRNDPCPCGSGRKFKKCCGHPSRAGASASPPSVGVRAPMPAGRGPVGPGPGMPELRTFDGELLSLDQAHYLVTDRGAVREALQACPDLEEDPDDGSFVWSRRIDEDEWRLLGNIRLEGEKLILECMSDERLARGKALLAELAGEHLAHLADTTQDPWQAVQEARESGSARRARGSEDALPPELADQAIQTILDRHYATWPDESLPALDGRTAREAVTTPTGRKDVAALLRVMEEMEAGKPPGQRYDFGKLWTELGIEGLR